MNMEFMSILVFILNVTLLRQYNFDKYIFKSILNSNRIPFQYNFSYYIKLNIFELFTSHRIIYIYIHIMYLFIYP